MRQFPMILKIVITVSYRTFFCFASHWQKLASIVNSIFLGLQELTLLFVPHLIKTAPLKQTSFQISGAVSPSVFHTSLHRYFDCILSCIALHEA